MGSRVLNKVELHFDADGLSVAVAPQGLFTLAGARPALSLTWPEITVLSATNIRAVGTPVLARVLRGALNVCRMRLDLPDQLTIGTNAWTMSVGVRRPAPELETALQQLRASGGPTPAVSPG